MPSESTVVSFCSSSSLNILHKYENHRFVGAESQRRLVFPSAKDGLSYERYTLFGHNAQDDDADEDEDSIYCEIGRPCLEARLPDGCSHVSTSESTESLRGDPTNNRLRLAIVLGVVSSACGLALAVFFALRSSATMHLVEQHFVLLSDGQWYFFSSERARFDEALDACERLGGGLVEVRSAADHDVVTEHLSTLRLSDWWVGATDGREEGTFVWVSDGAAVDNSSSLWASGQPDNWPDQPGEPEEDCVVYTFSALLEGAWAWNDLSCESTAKFICKRKKSII